MAARPIVHRMRDRDNVTPFRPRRRREPNDGWRTPRGQVLVQHGLTAGTFALFYAVDFLIPAEWLRWLALALGVAAIAIAMARRNDGMPWARTHHEVAARTLIIGACANVAIDLVRLAGPSAALVWLGLKLALAVWIVLRVGAGAVRGVLRLPFERPRTWLV